mgnify:CR=1 FL=1
MSAVAAPPPHREGSDFEEYRGDHKVDDAKGEQLWAVVGGERSIQIDEVDDGW